MPRPKKPAGETRDLVIPIRFTSAEGDRLRTAATHEHLTLSAWLRKVVLDAAGRVNDRASKRAALSEK